MNINLTLKQEQIVNDELKSGQFSICRGRDCQGPRCSQGKMYARHPLTTTDSTMTPCAKYSNFSRKTALLCKASLGGN